MQELKNYKGGVVGIFIVAAVYALLYFAAFMLAYGDPEPRARMALHIIGFIYKNVHPVLGMAIGYALGAFSFVDNREKH